MVLNVLPPSSSVLRELREHNSLQVVIFGIFEAKSHNLIREAADNSSQVGVDQVLRDQAASLMALEKHLKHQMRSQVHLEVGDEVIEEL